MGCNHSNANGAVADQTTQQLAGYGKVSMDTVITDSIMDETSKSVPFVNEEMVKDHGIEVNDSTVSTATDGQISMEHPIEVVVKQSKVIDESETIHEPDAIIEPEAIKEVEVFNDQNVIKEHEAITELVLIHKLRVFKELEAIKEVEVIDEPKVLSEPKAIEEVTLVQKLRVVDEPTMFNDLEAIKEVEEIEELEAINELELTKELEASDELEVIKEFKAINETGEVEADVMEEATMKEKKALVENKAQKEVKLQEEEESLVVENFPLTTTNASIWTFVAEKVTFTVGVAYFNVFGFNSQGGKVHLTKRFSEFKVLHAEMAMLMSEEELVHLPGSSFLQGRNDKALLQKRELAFVKMLNCIAQHPESSQSAAFVAFLA